MESKTSLWHGLPAGVGDLSSKHRFQFDLVAIFFLAIVAGWVFFYGLGRTTLTDWDEAWHAQIASEILSRGDWLWLHYRGLPYFNKPPLTFWLKAIAFRVGGVNEASARFFPAFFGYASVMVLAWFFAKVFDRRVGIIAGFILCTSWLFTLHHAGRSGETDSTLIFFHILTFISLWQSRQNARWFYIAGLFTALGWMTKGSTAYLIWPAFLLGRLLEGRWHRRLARALCSKKRGRDTHATQEIPSATAAPTNRKWIHHAIGGLALSFCLTLPWQGLMLLRHGRVFAQAFYVGEGALPAMQVIENHPGRPTFYIQIFHAFFEPWFLLAASTVVWKLARIPSPWYSGGRARVRGLFSCRETLEIESHLTGQAPPHPPPGVPGPADQIAPAVYYLIAWGGLILLACTLFATKMVWYATPAIPPLAGLAAVAGVELGRRRAGLILLTAIAAFGIYQVNEQSWTWANQSIAAVLILLIRWTLASAPLVQERWRVWLTLLCLSVPIAAHFRVIYGVIVHGISMAEWAELRVDDEPWRDLCRRIDRDYPGQPILLVGVPLHPAVYFYLHHLRLPADVNSIAYENIGEVRKLMPHGIIITRIELADPLRALHFVDQFTEGSLLIMRGSEPD